MLPDRQNLPTQPLQFPQVPTVPCLIGLKVGNPEIHIGLGQRTMGRAGVPETPIDENRQSLPRKHEVRFDISRGYYDPVVPPPARKAYRPHGPDHGASVVEFPFDLMEAIIFDLTADETLSTDVSLRVAGPTTGKVFRSKTTIWRDWQARRIERQRPACGIA